MLILSGRQGNENQIFKLKSTAIRNFTKPEELIEYVYKVNEVFGLVCEGIKT
jgi:hypothetical protein